MVSAWMNIFSVDKKYCLESSRNTDICCHARTVDRHRRDCFVSKDEIMEQKGIANSHPYHKG